MGQRGVGECRSIELLIAVSNGARRGGTIRETIEPCLEHGVGIVQLPRSEQHAWGDVLKRRSLFFYGSKGSRVISSEAFCFHWLCGTLGASIASMHDGQQTRPLITRMLALPFWASSANRESLYGERKEQLLIHLLRTRCSDRAQRKIRWLSPITIRLFRALDAGNWEKD